MAQADVALDQGQHAAKAFPRELRWTAKYYMRPYNDRWYGEIFEPKEGRTAGEITPAYSVLRQEKWPTFTSSCQRRS